MKFRKTSTLSVAALAMLVAAPVVAHHAFGAEFDLDAPIRIEGRVTRLEWVNPHTWVHIAVTEMVIGGQNVVTPDPSQEVRTVEGGTPNTHLRRGLRRR